LSIYKTPLLAIAAAAALVSFDTVADEPDASAKDRPKDEFESELLYREFPTDERGSKAREHWVETKKIDEKLQPASERLRHRDRALTSSDFKALAESSPGVEVGRAEIAGSKNKDDDSEVKKTPEKDKHK